MDVKRLIDETLEISRSGSYEINGRLVELPCKDHTSDVRVYNPDKVKECVMRARSMVAASHGKALFFVDELDSFMAAKKYGLGKTLVLNFANAYHPGGGFLFGAVAQEEMLCRCSTLYPSLTSLTAEEMYCYNNEHRGPDCSDYLLLSPCVAVFRDENYSLLTEPFLTSVISAAAPNLEGEERHLSPERIQQIFERKIENVLAVAAYEGYETLILGAWGCGAFGNDAKDVSQYFFTKLIGEKYDKLFKKIVFSIYVPKTARNTYNLSQFQKQFNIISRENNPRREYSIGSITNISQGGKTMNMIMQHQKHSTLSNGLTIDVGEDGYPYAKDNLIIVADGLGGRGGYFHTKINPEILNRETFFNAVFVDGYDLADDDYKEFVLTSFRELFALKDTYLSDANGKRTSGYFASRLVTAIVLYELRFNPEFQKDTVFSTISERTPEEVDRFAKELGARLAKNLQKRLSNAAQRMGLELESKTKGNYLLPSTLVVAIVNERERDAEVLYLWAGDSRGYFWDIDGLGQITEDHERDETMYNLVTLTKPFQIEGRFVKVEKPVLLFNATDGCYKCQCFASPFDLEYIFLQALVGANSFENASAILDTQFASIGTHDDSNTMGLISFGYCDYESVKQAAQKRIEQIHSKYVSRLPDILERDYSTELEEVEGQMGTTILTAKDKLIENENVCNYVKECLIKANYQPYEQELQTLKLNAKKLNEDSEAIHKDLVRYVQYYWLRAPHLKSYSAANNDVRRTLFGKREEVYRIAQEYEDQIDAAKKNLVKDTNLLMDEFRRAVETLLNDKDSLMNTSGLCNGKVKELISPHVQSVQFTLNRINDLLDCKTRDCTVYKKATADLSKLNQDYVEQDMKAIMDFINNLHKKGFIDGILLPPWLRDRLANFINTLKTNLEKWKAVDCEINGLPEKYLMQFWNERAREIINGIWRNHRELLSDDIMISISDKFGDLQVKQDQLVHALETRRCIYEEYEKIYMRLYREATL